MPVVFSGKSTHAAHRYLHTELKTVKVASCLACNPSTGGRVRGKWIFVAMLIYTASSTMRLPQKTKVKNGRKKQSAWVFLVLLRRLAVRLVTWQPLVSC